MLKKNSRIFITGHKGLVGSAIFNKFKLLGYKKIITANKNNLDLRNQRAVNHFFKKNAARGTDAHNSRNTVTGTRTHNTKKTIFSKEKKKKGILLRPKI